MTFFDKYLSVFVLIGMVIGVLIGQYLEVIPNLLNRLTFAEISLPIGVLIWLMIYPSMLKVDFTSIVNVGKSPKGLYLTWVVNWLIKPFTMFLIAGLFFLFIYRNIMDSGTAAQYLAGAVILGAAPCTAMVFVWSHLTRGNPAYTLVQVATNNLILLVLFVPIVGFLLYLIPGISDVLPSIPWATLFLSVGLFVVVPLTAASLTRAIVIRKKGLVYLNQHVIPKFSKVTITGLLLTLVLIFSLQSDLIINNPLHIVLIGIPLIIQTFFIFGIGYFAAKKMRLTHDVASPAAMIGASNFFELAVAVAIAISPVVALAAVVGLLVEVPIMLLLVRISNKTRKYFVQAAVN